MLTKWQCDNVKKWQKTTEHGDPFIHLSRRIDKTITAWPSSIVLKLIVIMVTKCTYTKKAIVFQGKGSFGAL